ncbi:MAG: AAA family ATPase [Ilumatobacteraceae bacterium]
MATTDSTAPFPELATEQERLRHSLACRDGMIERLSSVDPETAADAITKEYIEVTVADALEDLRTPGAGQFFGRIDEEGGDRWYIGRRHIEDSAHDPVVVDWRAPIAAPFYRATVADPVGLAHRRRFTLDDGRLTAYLDERLDDPDHPDAASGIPDPVLAEIGAERTGQMREIVATIQAEQDVVIRAPLEGCLVVQGGPGTGKTAVGLHRAAYLLFEHRRRLLREKVLVVGPNQVFLDYIGDVLPSLGERSVQQRTIHDLAVPRVEVTAIDPPEVARLKGDPRMLDVLAQAIRNTIAAPTEAIRVPIGVRTLVFEPDDIAAWLDEALRGTAPFHTRKEGLKALARREVLRKSGKDEAWGAASALRTALNKAWPTTKPEKLIDRLLANPAVLAQAAAGVFDDAERALLLTRKGRNKGWTAADQLLIDEANSLLNGPPFTFGHVVVDEAQDLSAVGLRCVGRRSPEGSFTILGDLAQSTTPAGQGDWEVVGSFLGTPGQRIAELTIGYRVPAPILEEANRLLPLTGVEVSESRSVREIGAPPGLALVASGEVAATVARTVEALKHHHRLVGVVAPDELHGPIDEALEAIGYRGVGHVQHLDRHDIPRFGAEAVKGLEFDAVVVANPHQILGEVTADRPGRGARLLYVAMTRAVQRLEFVSDRPLPSPLG